MPSCRNCICRAIDLSTRAISIAVWHSPPSPPRLHDWLPALSFSCSPCHCYSPASWTSTCRRHYGRRDVAYVRLPSTRRPEEVSAGALSSLGRFCTNTKILSGAAVSTKTAVDSSDCSRKNSSPSGLPHGLGDEPQREYVIATSQETVWVIPIRNFIDCLFVELYDQWEDSWTGLWTREY